MHSGIVLYWLTGLAVPIEIQTLGVSKHTKLLCPVMLNLLQCYCMILCKSSCAVSLE